MPRACPTPAGRARSSAQARCSQRPWWGSRRRATRPATSATASCQVRSEAAPDRALGDRHGKAAAADVLGRAEQLVCGGTLQKLSGAPPRVRDRATAGDPRAPRRRGARTPSRPCPVRPRRGGPPGRPRCGTAGRTSESTSSISPTTPICAVGAMRPSGDSLYRLTLPPVTGTPSARHASRHPADRLGQLPVGLGVARVAEVEAVGDAQRPRAGHGDVARALGHGERGRKRRIVQRDATAANRSR